MKRNTIVCAQSWCNLHIMSLHTIPCGTVDQVNKNIEHQMAQIHVTFHCWTDAYMVLAQISAAASVVHTARSLLK